MSGEGKQSVIQGPVIMVIYPFSWYPLYSSVVPFCLVELDFAAPLQASAILNNHTNITCREADCDETA